MDVKKIIPVHRNVINEAIKEYLAIREITFNVDTIEYVIDENGTLLRAVVEAH